MSPVYWYINESPKDDEKYDSLLYHVNSGDYFSTLATIIGFFLEEMKTSEKKYGNIEKLYISIASGVMDELKYLQKHFKITTKDR